MLWLNRLHQRLSLTWNESLALLSLSGLLMIGLGARHIQQQAVPVPVGAHDEMDRLFFERSAAAESLPDSMGEDVDQGPPLHPAARSSAAALRVDLNAAAMHELELLPRIGPKMAERILAFRAAFGPFGAVDDLRQIRGIGERTVELLRPHVFVSNEESDTKPP